MALTTQISWRRRLTLAAGAVACLGAATAAKPADAQISIQLPFVSLGVGYPAYYPYYGGYYGYYGYPYYHRAYYGGWRRCHWRHHHCHYH